MFLLDTNVWVAYLRGKSPSVRRRIESLSPGDVVLCSVVLAELYYGASKSAQATKNLRRRAEKGDEVLVACQSPLPPGQARMGSKTGVQPPYLSRIDPRFRPIPRDSTVRATGYTLFHMPLV